jgi:LysM repeat protein
MLCRQLVISSTSDSPEVWRSSSSTASSYTSIATDARSGISTTLVKKPARKGEREEELTGSRCTAWAQDEVVHVVEGGETMWDLAQDIYDNRGCSVDDLRVANSLTPIDADFLRLGQRVRVPNCTGVPLDEDTVNDYRG